MKDGHKRLFIPGPTEVPRDVLDAHSTPQIGHRPAEFTELYTRVIGNLEKFFGIDGKTYRAVTHTASGTIWMDMVIRSLVKKKVLCTTCGSFSERQAETAKVCGKEVDVLTVEWGKAVKPEMIRERLQADPEIDTVTIVHNETSTGVRNPIYEIGKMIREEFPEVMLAIDSVSALGGDLVEPAKVGADVIFTSTQKCFAVPPGLSMAIISDRAMKRIPEVDNRGYYTDILAITGYYDKKQQTFSTPSTPLLWGLDVQLKRMVEETYQKRHERHVEMAQYARAWAKKHFKLFAEEGYESNTVTTVANTDTAKYDVSALNKALGERGWMIANGYGDLKNKTFRLGHMGEWTLSDLKELLWHIEEIWGL